MYFHAANDFAFGWTYLVTACSELSHGTERNSILIPMGKVEFAVSSETLLYGPTNLHGIAPQGADINQHRYTGTSNVYWTVHHCNS